MASLVAEVVANSNSQIQVLTANVYSNGVTNGTCWRITTGGFTSPAPNPSSVNQQIQPSVTLNVYFGSTGTSTDQLLGTVTIPPQNQFNFLGFTDGPVGNFIYDGLVTLRGNTVGAAAAGGNVKVTMLSLNPFGLAANPTSNGALNAAITSNTTGNISVYAVASGVGQNANVVFEQCLITTQT